MTIPTETKDMLLRLRERIPPEQRDAFVASIKTRLGELASRHAVYYTLLGGLIGHVLGHLPLVGWITEHHQTEIGMAVGAWVGVARDQEERKHRETIQSVVEEAIQNALAKSH